VVETSAGRAAHAGQADEESGEVQEWSKLQTWSTHGIGRLVRCL